MRLRHVLVCVCLLALLAGPAVALAQGGGSAGDQQYTDPFGSSTTTHTSAAPPTTPASTTPAASPSTTPASAPTATAATATAGSGQTLPYTGDDLWVVAGIGLTLMSCGLLIRSRSKRA